MQKVCVQMKSNAHIYTISFFGRRSSENPGAIVCLKVVVEAADYERGRIKDSRVVSQFSFERPWRLKRIPKRAY